MNPQYVTEMNMDQTTMQHPYTVINQQMQPLQLQLGASNIPYSQHYDYYQMYANDSLTSDLYNSTEDDDDAIRTRNLIIKIGEFLQIHPQGVLENDLYSFIFSLYDPKNEKPPFATDLIPFVSNILRSNSLFQSTDIGNGNIKWYVNNIEFQAYRAGNNVATTASTATVASTSANSSSNINNASSTSTNNSNSNNNSKRKYSDLSDSQQMRKRRQIKKRVKKSDLLTLFQRIVGMYHSTQGGNAVLEDNPFRQLSGDEDEQGLEEKFGSEKFLFILQLVNFFDELLLPPIPKSEFVRKTDMSDKTISEVADTLKNLSQSIALLSDRVLTLERRRQIQQEQQEQQQQQQQQQVQAQLQQVQLQHQVQIQQLVQEQQQQIQMSQYDSSVSENNNR